MKQYHKLLFHILEKGIQKGDRTGTGTLSTFGYQMRFDLSEGFPVVTTKKLHLRSIIIELLWFLQGDTNIKYLKENGIQILGLSEHSSVVHYEEDLRQPTALIMGSEETGVRQKTLEICDSVISLSGNPYFKS